MGFVVGKVSLRQNFLRVLRVSRLIFYEVPGASLYGIRGG